ncbi:MAG: metallophosphoesterase [Bacteroidales bacterium]|nr:metallophosphoesterase [Bacteroidales bacterium]
MKIKWSILFISLVSLGSSCNKNETPSPEVDPIQKNYIHISHTRTGINPNMDSIAELIEYKKFDMVWLGGDMANLTSQDDETMYHIDSILGLGNFNTLWSLGNHDYSDLVRIQSFTNRPPYYSYNKDGITYIVLDTQDSLSNIVGFQKELFDHVVDTINKSSHLVILHHKLIWMYNNPDLEPQIDSIPNGGFGDCFFCINPNNFYTDLYPKLLEVKRRGIEVICIGGDIGFNAKEFHYTTKEGLHFLASGISAGSHENKALIFKHDITNKRLTWEFKLISGI